MLDFIPVIKAIHQSLQITEELDLPVPWLHCDMGALPHCRE
jgi:hypothetical protein